MNHQSTEKIIGKIRKVLELSKNNPSQAEAESAALKAQKLMAGFNGSGIKNAFLTGYLEGIKESLEKQCTALMIIVPEEVESAYTDKISEFKTISINLSYKNTPGVQKAKEEGRKIGKTAIMGRGIEETV